MAQNNDPVTDADVDRVLAQAADAVNKFCSQSLEPLNYEEERQVGSLKGYKSRHILYHIISDSVVAACVFKLLLWPSRFGLGLLCCACSFSI